MQHITQELRESLTQPVEPTPSHISHSEHRRHRTPPTHATVRNTDEPVGYDSPAVQHALEDLQAEHDARGGDEGSAKRIRGALADVRGHITANHVVDTARTTTSAIHDTLDTTTEQIQPSSFEEEDDDNDGVIELDESELEEVRHVTVDGRTISVGDTVEIKRSNGNGSVQYEVTNITSEDGPERLILRSLDGRIDAFKDVQRLRNDPTTFQIIQ